MKSQFNVGDKVKVVRGEGSDLKNGDIFTVYEDDVCGYAARVNVQNSCGTVLDNLHSGFNDSRFELVKEKVALDFTKPIINGRGQVVTILSTSAEGTYPIVGQPKDGCVQSFTESGQYYVGTKSDEDLMQSPEPKKEFVRYFNVYASGAMPCHSTRADAEANSTSDRIACKKVVFTEDEYDD